MKAWAWALIGGAASLASAALAFVGWRAYTGKLSIRAALTSAALKLEDYKDKQAKLADQHRAFAHARRDLEEKIEEIAERAKEVGGMTDDEIKAELDRRNLR